MQKKIVYPALAVLLGGAGFALRRWELATAFEETGLVTPGMPATLSLIALSAGAGILCALLGWRRRGVDYGDYDTAFEAKDCPLYMGAVVLSAFFLMGAAVLKLMGLPTAYREAAALAAQGSGGNPALTMLLPILMAALSAAAGICVLRTGRNAYRGEPTGKYSALVLMPAYLCCVWLIAAYQNRAADPVIQDYIYELLAVICVLLSVYYLSSFAFETPKAGRALCFSLLAVYFSMTTLADAHDWATMALYGFGILYPLTMSAVLLSKTGKPREKKGAGDTEETEETPNEG